jgi:RNA recognition motif-containing protein
MDNKKVFIGNLNFEVTESDLRQLLSKFGEVTGVMLNQKKGFAIVEMSTADQAEKAVQELSGTMFRDREIRIKLETKTGRTRPASSGKLKERAKSFSPDREPGKPSGKTGRTGNRDSVKHSADDKERDRDTVSSHGKYKGEYSERFKKMAASMSDSRAKSAASDSDDRQGGRNRRDGSQERGRVSRSAEKSSGSGKTRNKEWTTGQPLSSDGPKLGEERENHMIREKSGIFHRPKERPAGDGERGNHKREWRTEKNSASQGRPGNRRDERPSGNEPREERSGNSRKPRAGSGSSDHSTRSSRPGSGESGRGRSSGSSGGKSRGGAGGSRNSRHKRD